MSLYFHNENQEGGGKQVFDYTAKFYIIVRLREEKKQKMLKILDRYKRKIRTSTSYKDTLKNCDDPHITLLEFNINMDSNFGQRLRDRFEKNFTNNHSINLTKLFRKFKLSERPIKSNTSYKTLNNYFVKMYESNGFNISKFRTWFYNEISKICGYENLRLIQKVVDRQSNGRWGKYHVFSNDGVELYAVPDYYYGKDKWEPHLSLFQKPKSFPLDEKLLEIYRNMVNVKDKSDIYRKIYRISYRNLEKIEFNLQFHTDDVDKYLDGNFQRPLNARSEIKNNIKYEYRPSLGFQIKSTNPIIPGISLIHISHSRFIRIHN
jgi:hypothetical protein